jgi:hypothetical protein
MSVTEANSRTSSYSCGRSRAQGVGRQELRRGRGRNGYASPRQRRRKAYALAFGRRSRVNTPFLLPSTREMPERVAKSAKLQICSPTTASIRSKTRWYIARSSTWNSSLHGSLVMLCSPGCVSAPYSVITIGLPRRAHSRSSASSWRSAATRSPVLTYQPKFWLGPALTGQQITIWADTTVVHLLCDDGVRLKSVPSRFSLAQLHHLLSDGGREAGPARIAGAPIRRSTAIEVDRTINACGLLGLAGRQHPVGYHLTGRRVTARLDHGVLHLLDHDRTVLRTLPNPLSAADLARIRDARPAGPAPARKAVRAFASVPARPGSTSGGPQKSR